MRDIYKLDLFYIDLVAQEMEWIYFNPDSAAGGQFVTNVFGRALFEQAICLYDEPEEAFKYIEERAKQYLADVGTKDFEAIKNRLLTEEPLSVCCGYITIDQLELMIGAYELINAFCEKEYQGEADFTDLRKIPIAYTTTEDEHHEIQSYVNLVDYRIETYLDGRIAAYRSFESLHDMAHWGLSSLAFDDLVYVPDWVIQNFEELAEKEESKDVPTGSYVARIDYLSTKGIPGDSMEFQSEQEFLRRLHEDLDCGVPLIVTLYRDEDGKTISRDFLQSVDTLPKGLSYEDAPHIAKNRSDRSDAR